MSVCMSKCGGFVLGFLLWLTSLSKDFLEHVKINTPCLFEFLTLFQDTARFFVLGSLENSLAEKKPLLTADLTHKLPMHIQRKNYKY
jgi:hypothetical protein